MVIGIGLVLYVSGIIGFGPKEVIVPDVINKRVLEASDILDENGLILDLNSITRQLTKDTPAGLIISVEPKVGEMIEKGSSIKVVVSDGISATMSDYVGKNIDEAIKELSQYSNLRIVKETVASDVKPGTIITQTGIAPNAEFDPAKNNTIKFTYSEYISNIIPFEIKGMNLNDAKAKLDELKITYVVEKVDIESLGLSDEDKKEIESMEVVRVNPDVGTSYTQTNDSFVTLYYVE